MHAGEVAFREQLSLSLKPMLHLVAGQRTLVHITEVCPSGHFVRGGRKISFSLAQGCNRGWLWCAGRFWVSVLGEFIVFHIWYHNFRIKT
jgi:hypothetical protein